MERYQLRPNEKVLEVARRHIFMLVAPLSFLFLLLLLDFFFMPQLFRGGTVGMVFFFSIIAVVGLAAGRIYLIWGSTHMILTSMRVIDVDRAGFFSWTISEAELDRIQDVMVERHGLLDMILRTGALTIQSSGSSVRLELTRVSRPMAMRAAITEAQDKITGRYAEADDGVDKKLKDLPEKEQRVVKKYVDHLRSKRALQEFSEQKED